jgi:hypothetical protein
MTYAIPLRDALLHPVRTALRQGTQSPYRCVVHDPVSYIDRTPRYKIVKKFLHKFLSIACWGQAALLRDKIRRTDRILFLYTGKDSFGDANLELCGRALLRGLGVAIDLLTLPKLSQQFKEDDIFQRVYTDISQVAAHTYDVVLLAEFNHRSLRLKRKHFRRTPFACLFGYFDGPSRNQACFSHAAFNDLFDLGLDDAAILARAKPYLSCARETIDSVAHLLPAGDFIAISIGGVDPYRTYSHWSDVLQLLNGDRRATGIKHVVLIGSDNGQAMADTLSRADYSSLTVTSLVGKLSLLQTRAVISKARLFVGCDGGLMHVAHSTQTPSVTLFSSKEPYSYWLTEACRSTPIQSPGGASEIRPDQIMLNVRRALGLRTR